MALLFYVIKFKTVQFSKLTCCVYHVTFFFAWIFCKKESIIPKRYAWKCCGVVKSYWWHMEKNICWENYITQRRILCQVIENPLLSEGCERRKNIQKKIVLIHWQMLQLSEAALWKNISGRLLLYCLFWLCQFLKSVKKRCYRGGQTCFFFKLCGAVLLILVFWTNCFC